MSCCWPVRSGPATILVGKLLSSLSYLVILIVSSLPLMILCYLLGGLLLSEITRAYLVLILAAGTFGLLSVACSSFFRRTSSALVVSYLVILPLAVACVVLTRTEYVEARDFVSIAVLPPWCLATWTVLGILVNGRLLRPPDVGSEGKDVVDEEEEMKYAIGVVIDRELFPDKLFAPAKRHDLMPDGTNPVLDKELRSEIFSQGTLMLRVVIQVSMLLSIPLMAFLLFLRSDLAAYYVAYVLTFNLLVGPVFSAGSITQERERQTLEPAADDLAPPRQDRDRQVAGGAAGLHRLDLLADRADPARLRPAARASGPVLDAGRLPADHRHHLPGDLVDRAVVLVAGQAVFRGDGPDVPELASPLRDADGTVVVSPGDRVGEQGAIGRLLGHQPVLCGAERPHADDPQRCLHQRAGDAHRFHTDPGRAGHPVAGLGDLSVHLPAVEPRLLPVDLPGLPMAMVAIGGTGLVPSRSPAALLWRPLGKVPLSRYHMLSGPRHQADDWPGSRRWDPAWRRPRIGDLQGELGLDPGLARALLAAKFHHFEHQRSHRSGLASLDRADAISPVGLESFEGPVRR